MLFAPRSGMRVVIDPPMGGKDMKSIHLNSKIGRALLAFSFLFTIVIAASTEVQAQYRDRDGSYRRDRNDDGRYRRDRDRDWRRNRDRDRDGRDDHYERNGGYGNYGGYGGNVYRAAMNQGYQDGLNTGARDAERGQSYNPQRSRYYKNANSGYNSGNNGQSKQAYRNGFVRGYQEGYRQYGGYRRDDRRNSGGGILGEIFGRP